MNLAIIIGSLSDLSQSDKGLHFLSTVLDKINVIGVYVRSQHRNTLDVQELLMELVRKNVDVIIVGAGWANHLTGCSDAFLRYTLQNDKIVVIGVAFEDPCPQGSSRTLTILNYHQYLLFHSQFLGCFFCFWRYLLSASLGVL